MSAGKRCVDGSDDSAALCARWKKGAHWRLQNGRRERRWGNTFQREARSPGETVVTESFDDLCARVWTEWKNVPYVVKEDEVNQALMAFSTNFAKIEKQWDRNSDANLKSFTVIFRKSSRWTGMILREAFLRRRSNTKASQSREEGTTRGRSRRRKRRKGWYTDNKGCSERRKREKWKAERAEKQKQ